MHVCRLALAALLSLSVSGCVLERPEEKSRRDLDKLATWMSGTFSSQAQAAADPDYYDIQLVMHPIWDEREDGPWLYVEQARGDKLERPYRQRVYRLRVAGHGVTSDVYTLPGDPLRFAGAWKAPALLATIGPGDLELREGCSIHLRPVSLKRFEGSTDGDLCPSELAGAKYATSEVVISADSVLSWDRGFDSGGQQVWGAEKGPYQFVKLTD